MKILVVDDTEKNLNAAKEAFGEMAIYCSTPTEALQALESEQLDFVLTDLVMPKYSNEKRVKQEQELKNWKKFLDKVNTKGYDFGEYWSEEKIEEKRIEAEKNISSLTFFEPAGLEIALKAIEKSVPVAIVSYLGNHSAFEWAFHVAQQMFVGEDESPEYPWRSERGYCVCHGYNSENNFGLFSEYIFEKYGASEEDLKGSPEGWKRIFKLFSETKKTRVFEDIPV